MNWCEDKSPQKRMLHQRLSSHIRLRSRAHRCASAIQRLEQREKFYRARIYTDSMQAIRNLNNIDGRRLVAWNIIQRGKMLRYTERHITIAWIPGHAGIEGDLRVDALAANGVNNSELAARSLRDFGLLPARDTYNAKDAKGREREERRARLASLRPTLRGFHPKLTSRKHIVSLRGLRTVTAIDFVRKAMFSKKRTTAAALTASLAVLFSICCGTLGIARWSRKRP